MQREKALAVLEDLPDEVDVDALAEPEDLFDSKIVGCTPKAASFGIQLGMTGRQAVEFMLQASRHLDNSASTNPD